MDFFRGSEKEKEERVILSPLPHPLVTCFHLLRTIGFVRTTTLATQTYNFEKCYVYRINVLSFLLFQGEVDILKSRLAKLEKEKKELEEANEKLQQKVKDS